MTRRHAVRGLLIAPDQTLLMMRVEEPITRNSFWITPGGGVEAGESDHETARREVWEETGYRPVEIGPLVWIRTHEFTWNHVEYAQTERYYLIPVEKFEPTIDQNPVAHEADVFRGWHWWSLDEILASDEAFAPIDIRTCLSRLLDEGPPPEPIEVL